MSSLFFSVKHIITFVHVYGALRYGAGLQQTRSPLKEGQLMFSVFIRFRMVTNSQKTVSTELFS